jgi:hypothetical protein
VVDLRIGVEYEAVFLSNSYSHVHIVSKICRKSIFFHPSFPRQKIRQVSVEISTFGLAKKSRLNHIIKPYILPLNHHFVTGVT